MIEGAGSGFMTSEGFVCLDDLEAGWHREGFSEDLVDERELAEPPTRADRAHPPGPSHSRPHPLWCFG